MKSIKKLKSYSKTVAGTALLLGATVAGGASFALADNHNGSSGDSYTLGDYPHPFVDEDGNVATNIVVGEDAKTADVVGAIDIAGSLGNAAFTEEAVEGSSSAAVNGEQLDEEKVGGTVADATIDASDYDTLTRETMEDDDGNDVFVTESASITDLDSNINGTETEIKVSQNEVSYTAQYSPGFAENDTLLFLGEEYELVNVVDDSELDLGSTMEETGLVVGDSYDHGPYTVEVVDKDEENSQIYVRVSEGEEVLKSKGLESGEEIEVDDGDFLVEADSVFFGSNQDYIDLTTTNADTTLEEGEPLPMDEDYQVASSGISLNSNDEVTSLKVDNLVETKNDPADDEPQEISHLEPGQALEGPNGMFSVTNQGVTSESMNDIEFASDFETTFTDVNAQEHTFDVRNLQDGADIETNNGPGDATDAVIGLEGENKDTTGDGDADYYPVEVTDISSDGSEVTVKHNEFEQTFDLGDASTNTGGTTATGTSADNVAYETVSTGYGFSVTVEWADTDADGNTDPSSIEEINLYNGDYSSGSNNNAVTVHGVAAVTTQNGAELAYDSDVTSAGNTVIDNEDGSLGTGDFTDYNTGTIDGVVVDEATGVTATANNPNQIYVAYENGGNVFSDVEDGEISSVLVEGQGNELSDEEDGDSSLSTFGTTLELDSATSANLGYPDEERFQQVAVGSVEEGSTEGATTMTPTGFPQSAALDSEVTSSDRENSNMILVGGPAVNDLTAELADEGMTWNASEYESNEGVGVLDLVEGAFSDGNHALVVAGHQADDTRAASEFIANYQEHAEDLAEATTVQVSTENNQVVE